MKMDGKMDEQKNGWKIKIDEKKRWSKHVYNQELCVDPNIICSQLKGMCQLKHHMFISNKYVPIRNWDNMRPHILYTISTYFLFEFNLLNLLCLRTFLLFEYDCDFCNYKVMEIISAWWDP
jgi:hypothetical protein